MRGPAECGSACVLRRHANPALVARLVMERSGHVMLAGPDADAFASAHGVPERETLAPAARAAWEAWRAGAGGGTAAAQARDRSLLRPVDTGDPATGALFGAGTGRARGEARWHGHDTIGTLALASDGRMAGACSTSGMPYKVPGRVGDSPIIGHGLYVEPGVGAATATGSGELIMGVCGAFLAVECLRRGATPLEAATEVVRRIGSAYAIEPHHQTAFIVLAADGRWSSAALRGGFLAARRSREGASLVPAEFVLRED
jgi:isoaspartyl peptidase/L-asparaginase-like protein (Ntn-hydrolase superfamily)